MAMVEDSTVNLLSACTKLLSAPRYEQVRVVKQWLSPILIKHFSGYATQSSYQDLADETCTVAWMIQFSYWAHRGRSAWQSTCWNAYNAIERCLM